MRRLAILNAPHPRVFRRLLRTTSQLLRSWYVFLFRLPWLPERLLAAFDFALLRRVLAGHWVQLDAPDEVSARLVMWPRGSVPRASPRGSPRRGARRPAP